MKWVRKLAQSVVTIVLQALVARLVYHLFAKKQPKETTKSNDQCIVVADGIKRKATIRFFINFALNNAKDKFCWPLN